VAAGSDLRGVPEQSHQLEIPDVTDTATYRVTLLHIEARLLTMSSSVVQASPAELRTPAAVEHTFFLSLTLAIAVSVVIGFAHTYFFAGMLRAKLPSPLVHLHGAAFSAWIATLVTQVVLVSARRVKWHMTLGLAEMFLAPLMIVFGFATMFAAIRRNFVPMNEMRVILVVNTVALLTFGGLVLWAYLARRDPASHKRLIMLATMSILGPAIDRWPFQFMGSTAAFFIVLDLFPLSLIVYDLATRRSLHRVTVWGVGLIAAWQITFAPIAHSQFIADAIAWMQGG
jgi:hypothetical protein